MEGPKLLRIKSLHDRSPDPDLVALTPEERMEMVWPLTVFAWETAGLPVGGPMRKDVARLFKRTKDGLIPWTPPLAETEP